MEAITKQYLDLYGQYSQQLRGRSPLVEHYREEAFDAFARLGLPRFKSEDYQRTDLPTLLSGAQWQLATEALPLAWEATELPEGARARPGALRSPCPPGQGWARGAQ